MREKGKITINQRWDLTNERKFALERLSELGVTVRSHIGEPDYLIEVPGGFGEPEYIEIGFLIAQLGDEVQPHPYRHIAEKIPLMNREWWVKFPFFYFKESHPAYMVFVVKPAKNSS